MTGRGRSGAELDVAAALRAGEDRERARGRRAVLMGLGAAGLLLALALGARLLWQPSLADLERDERASWERSQIISPSADPAPDGEEHMPFDGFGISADSEPPGAEVSVGGRALGRTPLLTAVECKPGEVLAVRFQLPGRPARERSTTCRADKLVKLRAKL